MNFHSILFEGPAEGRPEIETQAPDFFRDLNLDQVVDAITAQWKEYDLAPFFYTRLPDLEAVAFRQEIVEDLGEPAVAQAVDAFSAKMRDMRAHLREAQEVHEYKRAMQRLFLAAVDIYCQAVARLAEDLAARGVKSRGLLALREYLEGYAASAAFRRLEAEARKLIASLAAIRYTLLIKDGNITVRHYNGEQDYSAAVEETFEKFRRGAAADYSVEIPRWEGMNHIEAEIQDRVALLHPDIFGALETFCTEHAGYLDGRIAEFDREVQFYIAYLAYISKLRGSGLRFCLPQLSRTSKEVSGDQAFDLALAHKLNEKKTKVVCNDFRLQGAERILVVSGPNQGGKTTFARMFGQMHYLAGLGCPVPGERAELFFCDRLFTHFERQEDSANLRGKLQDDLVRIQEILEQATAESIVVMNEIFASTTLKDAVYLGKEIVGRMCELDLVGVCVTFLDELATLNEKTVSVVSLVEPENPAVRTFKLERRRADGLAHALAIAEKHRVTYEWLKRRMQP